MDSSTTIREILHDPHDTTMDAEVWKHDSHELCDLAETIVNRHPRFAWLIVEAWLSKHEQLLVNQE